MFLRVLVWDARLPERKHVSTTDVQFHNEQLMPNLAVLTAVSLPGAPHGTQKHASLFRCLCHTFTHSITSELVPTPSSGSLFHACDPVMKCTN